MKSRFLKISDEEMFMRNQSKTLFQKICEFTNKFGDIIKSTSEADEDFARDPKS